MPARPRSLNQRISAYASEIADALVVFLARLWPWFGACPECQAVLREGLVKLIREIFRDHPEEVRVAAESWEDLPGAGRARRRRRMAEEEEEEEPDWRDLPGSR